MSEKIIPGKWTETRLNSILKEASGISDPGERIGYLSGHFLDTPYNSSTLTGDMNTPEVFTINLKELDCLTFIEYIEAMRISGSFAEFKDNLRKVRYESGRVDYRARNHFFTDWKDANQGLIHDITASIGGGKSVTTSKNLNKKIDETFYLPGILPKIRKITFLPAEYADNIFKEQLMTGDYAGIYSEKAGLDVSHVGIIIKKDNSVYLRHASSSKNIMKVIDEDLSSYIKSKSGIIIFRPIQ